MGTEGEEDDDDNGTDDDDGGAMGGGRRQESAILVRRAVLGWHILAQQRLAQRSAMSAWFSSRRYYTDWLHHTMRHWQVWIYTIGHACAQHNCR